VECGCEIGRLRLIQVPRDRKLVALMELRDAVYGSRIRVTWKSEYTNLGLHAKAIGSESMTYVASFI
jgi:hypothetical protein